MCVGGGGGGTQHAKGWGLQEEEKGSRAKERWGPNEGVWGERCEGGVNNLSPGGERKPPTDPGSFRRGAGKLCVPQIQFRSTPELVSGPLVRQRVEFGRISREQEAAAGLWKSTAAMNWPSEPEV